MHRLPWILEKWELVLGWDLPSDQMIQTDVYHALV